MDNKIDFFIFIFIRRSFYKAKYARRKSSGGIVTKLLIELNKNKIAIDEEEYNSKKFDIKFSDKLENKVLHNLR